MRGSLEGAGGVIFVELFSELDGGGTSQAEIYTGGPIFPTAGWSPYSWTTTLGPDVDGGVTLQLKASCGPVVGCGVDSYFDNITITTDVAAVPLPAAAWLFGSALMGLVGMSRRRKS
ncbi:VPLPA-CTERM sorting domain-containing protein [Halieaceae bacterium IMCC14734]|uniref:VPLPA-CTERM sorting domain-containing protein n=2 Tax=Candidatus Litorirhabdus singularis TaxID=2518993 RepID=A0ABT3TKV8_9GAMM|nr:VPLPA-CTERM sorting domain-containing protein [Candidatus Litorirhabdus singularis]